MIRFHNAIWTLDGDMEVPMLEIVKVSKRLTPNDVNQGGISHQAGIHISRESQDLLAFFPFLDIRESKPEKPIEIVDQRDSKIWHFRFKYYNSKGEYRIVKGDTEGAENTSVSEFLRDVSAEDVVVFRKYKATYWVEWFDSSDTGSEYEKVTTHGNGRWRIFWAQMDSDLDRETINIPEGTASKKEAQIQKNSAITGKKAEDYFEEWAAKDLSDWGPSEDCTEKTGFGYDFYFPDKEYMVEVKGCMGEVEPIRMTETEWETAELQGGSYWLAVVSKLDRELSGEPKVDMIQDPFASLQNNAKSHTVIQVYYSISAGDLRPLLRRG